MSIYIMVKASRAKNLDLRSEIESEQVILAGTTSRIPIVSYSLDVTVDTIEDPL